MSTDVDVLVNLQSPLGEGPVWDHRSGVLAWVEIIEGAVRTSDIETGATTSVDVGSSVGALALYGQTDYLLAAGTGFRAFRTASGAVIDPVQPAFDDDELRMNDGAVDPAGRFLAGSMGNGTDPVGALYSRNVDGTIRPLLHELTVSNGIAWSSDGNQMFYVDSATQRIDVCDYDVASGSLENRRPWVEIAESDGIPDGIEIDAEGGIWLALWDGGAVRRYSPTGDLVHEIRLPVPRVTSCAFGGPNLDKLFITTAAVGVEAHHPGAELAGALFVADPGTTGVPARIVPAS